MEWLESPAGKVARLGTGFGWPERLGVWKVRWGIGRMGYIVPPGLYAIGNPGPDDPVVVTANYKMTFDIVRSSLAGRSVWLLVLETYGINVWCAAGKGTFGTGELVRRVIATGLARVVNHRRLILPLLGGAGVSAHQVAARCGFTVHYGPIRAQDLPAFLEGGMTTTAAMKELTFSAYERLVLIPVEVVLSLKTNLLVAASLLLLGTLAGGPAGGPALAGAYLGAALTGTIAGPLLLPWLPSPSFAVKGGVAGLIWSVSFYLLARGSNWSLPVTVASFLALPAVSAYFTLNFTGCTPFTSRSGVKKELRIGLPAMGIAILLGGVLLVLGTLV